METNQTVAPDTDVTPGIYALGRAYPEAAVSDGLLVYFSPVMMILGTAGNLVSVCVINSRHYKPSPSGVALTALALADILVLNTGLMRHWLHRVAAVNIRALSTAGCKVHLGLSYLAQALSGNTLAITTVDRLLSVWFPLKVRQWVTRRRMLLAVAVTWGLLLTAHAPLMVLAERRVFGTQAGCWTFDQPRFDGVWHWMSMVMIVFIPITVIASGNAGIIIGLCMAARRRRVTAAQGAKGHGSTTTMLVTVGLMYLLLVSPGSVEIATRYYGVWPFTTTHDAAKGYLAYTITQQLTYLNSSVNCFLYFASGSKFREAFIKLVRRLCACVRPDADNTISGVRSDVTEQSGVSMTNVELHTRA